MFQPTNGKEADVVSFGPFCVDRASGVLLKDGRGVRVPPKAMGVLLCLLERPGAMVSKEELLHAVWNDAAVTDGSLTEAMRALRSALDDDPQQPTYIETVHRRGYRFIAAVSETRGPPGHAVAHDTVPAGRGVRRLLQATSSRRSIAALSLIGVSLIVGAVGAGLLGGRAGEDLGGDVSQLIMALDDVPMRLNRNLFNMTISPDGRSVAYGGTAQGRLYVRHLDRTEAQPIAGSELSAGATFSPDGKQIAFFTFDRYDNPNPALPPTYRLMRASLDGGLPVQLATAVGNRLGPSMLGLSWGPDGTIVWATSEDHGLWILPPVDGAVPFLIADESERFYLWPQVLPDGKTVVATEQSCLGVECPAGGGETHIVAISLESGRRQVLLDGGGRARFVASGHLVIGRDQQLLAIPFDPETLAVYGSIRPVQPEVMSTGRGFDAVYFDVSLNGTLLYVSTKFPFRPNEVQMVARNGDAEPLSVRLTWPFLSPDGSKLIGVANDITERDLYTFTLGGGTSTDRLTRGYNTRKPIWTPEGNRVTFADKRNGNYDLYWMPVNGGSEATLLHDGEYDLAPESWSPDGKMLAFTETNPDSIEDIWLMNTVDGDVRPFLQTPFIESGAAFSPDGDWIAYHSDESGTFEVYLRRVPEDLGTHDAGGLGYKVPVSQDCGGWPVWAADGSELYFRSCATGTESFWAVSIDTESGEPAIGEPQYLFEGEYARQRRGPSFSVTPDGRFLLVDVSMAVNRLEVVQNWAETLEQLVPTRGR